jgi:hypothetical protein
MCPFLLKVSVPLGPSTSKLAFLGYSWTDFLLQLQLTYNLLRKVFLDQCTSSSTTNTLTSLSMGTYFVPFITMLLLKPI